MASEASAIAMCVIVFIPFLPPKKKKKNDQKHIYW